MGLVLHSGEQEEGLGLVLHSGELEEGLYGTGAPQWRAGGGSGVGSHNTHVTLKLLIAYLLAINLHNSSVLELKFHTTAVLHQEMDYKLCTFVAELQ